MSGCSSGMFPGSTKTLPSKEPSPSRPTSAACSTPPESCCTWYDTCASGKLLLMACSTVQAYLRLLLHGLPRRNAATAWRAYLLDSSCVLRIDDDHQG